MTAAPVLAAPLPTVRVTLAMRTISENNAREHHMARARRRKAQRDSAAFVLRIHLRNTTPAICPPYLVTLTRLAPRKLDSDNLQGSLKAVRDGVADALGVDDGDEGTVEWVYAQRPAKGPGLNRGQGVQVEIRHAAG